MKTTKVATVAAVAWVTTVLFAGAAQAQPAGTAPPATTAAPQGSTPPPTAAPPTAGPETTPTAADAPSGDASPPVRQNGHEPIPGTGAPPAEAKPAIPEWMRNVTLGGGVLLWYYQPISVTGVENNVSVFFANIILDGKWGIFGLHLEPRFRDTKLRPFFDGPVWLQEAYASIDLGDATELRIGKTYSHLGLFWDNSFYGNVQVYDGLKLDPDYGLSLAGTLGKKDDLLGLGWWAQYFVIDGGTNVSLEGRDTISIPGAHRRNQGILRAEPRLHFGPATIALGASGEFFQASDLPGYGTQNVWRVAGDAKLTVGNLGVWGEVSYQDGRSVTAFPIAGIAATATTPAVPGQSSSKVDYALAGAEYTVGPVTARYNVSWGNYADVSVYEWMHVPAIGVAISPNLSVLGEFVLWQQYSPAGTSLLDRSLNVTVKAHL
jgi:hypothetical protein